jgi:hypothetical protein
VVGADQINSTLRHVLFSFVEGQQEGAPSLIVHPAILGSAPLVMAVSADGPAELCPSNNDGVLYVVAELVEGRCLKLCSDARISALLEQERVCLFPNLSKDLLSQLNSSSFKLIVHSYISV